MSAVLSISSLDALCSELNLIHKYLSNHSNMVRNTFNSATMYDFYQTYVDFKLKNNFLI